MTKITNGRDSGAPNKRPEVAWPQTKLTIYCDDLDAMSFAVRAYRTAQTSDGLDSSLYGFIYGDGPDVWKVTLKVNKAGCSAWVYR